MAGRRSFVIGLDGGSWNVIHPLLERGEMPNLRELLRASAYGTLWSTIPPVTCPAWLTFSTALKPSRLGIYDFWGLRAGSNDLCFHSYAELERAEFWDLLMDSGLSCGIINNPLMFPRRRHRGYIIPGFLTPQEEFRSHPPGLMKELHGAVGGYEVDQVGGNVVDDATLLEDCLRVAEKRVRAIAHLVKKHPTDFFLGVFTSTDRVCHRFLNRAMLAEGRESDEAWEAIAAVYGKVDEGLGLVMEEAGEEDLLVVVSDHGFEPRSWNFHLNQYLVDEGLLEIKGPGRLERMGLTQRNLARMLDRVGLMKWMARRVPEGLKDILPRGATNLGEIPIHDLLARGDIVWRKTRALALGYGIYINTMDRPEGTVSGSEAEALRSSIRGDLMRMSGPGGELGIEVLEPQEAYSDPNPLNPPGLLVVERGDYQVRSTLDVEGRVFTPNRRAGHSPEGIIVVRGPGVSMTGDGLEASIQEVAGMVLRFHAVSPLPHMESRLAEKIFPRESGISPGMNSLPPEDECTAREMDRIRRRIERLKAEGLI